MRSPAIPRLALSLLLIVATIVLLFPFHWMLVSSLRTNPEIFTTRIDLLPRSLMLENYVRLLKETLFLRWMLNSIFIAFSAVALSLLLGAPAGFALAKYSFPGKGIIFAAVLLTAVMPRFVTVIPVFSLMAKYGLTNTYWALILPFAVNPYVIFLMRQYIIGVPNELLDAARIDGCGEIRIFFSVIAPLLKPAFGAAGIYALMLTWGEYLFALILMRDPTMMLFPVGLTTLKGMYEVEYGMIMAGSVLSVVPLILVFLFMQRQFVSGMMEGAVK